MAEPTPLLQVRGLTRRFGGLLAVSDLDLAVYPGEILGLIGPNGAGKSTTFAMIAGAIPSLGNRPMPLLRGESCALFSTTNHLTAWASKRT